MFFRKIDQSEEIVPIAKEDLIERKPLECTLAHRNVSTEIVLDLGAQDGAKHPIIEKASDVVGGILHAPPSAEARTAYQIVDFSHVEQTRYLHRVMGEVGIHDDNAVAG